MPMGEVKRSTINVTATREREKKSFLSIGNARKEICWFGGPGGVWWAVEIVLQEEETWGGSVESQG